MSVVLTLPEWSLFCSRILRQTSSVDAFLHLILASPSITSIITCFNTSLVFPTGLLITQVSLTTPGKEIKAFNSWKAYLNRKKIAIIYHSFYPSFTSYASCYHFVLILAIISIIDLLFFCYHMFRCIGNRVHGNNSSMHFLLNIIILSS